MRLGRGSIGGALAVALLTAAAGAAHAEGPSVGASAGAQSWSGGVDGVHGESRGLGAKLFVGYALSPHFAIEAGAMDLGRIDDRLGARASATGGYLDGVGRYEIAPQWSMLGRLGVARARFSIARGQDSTNGLKVGAGVQYDLSLNVALRGEYEYYRFQDAFDTRARIGQFTTGIKVSF
jgi:OOP family OmpA-OmpF porin